ncbi:hypothetical protein WJX72_005684 [[Myrmecia] bisecta]|uniref:J domain-containing protein n=1 Tax=[Myrmecia] bisecta TaxID=41462 RepID=A0AAW1PNU4_9CHLO
MFVTAGGAADSDPYKVLGVPANADSNTLQRVYKRKLYEAKGNDEETARIEAAHSSIMMSALTSRLKGGTSVPAEVKYADKAVYFPWRPRLHKASKNIILYSGILQALLAAWALLLTVTAGTQPVITSAVVGLCGQVWKQNQIYPSGTPSAVEKKQGVKNIARAMLLAFLATFGGCALFYTIPDAIAAALNKTMPFWFYESQKTLLALGSCSANWIMTSFYR